MIKNREKKEMTMLRTLCGINNIKCSDSKCFDDMKEGRYASGWV